MTQKNQYLFSLAIQITLPTNYREDDLLHEQLKLLENLGFFGVELNIADPSLFKLAEIQNFLAGFNLKMTKFASGLTAKTFQLSLSIDDETIRQNSILKCQEIIDFVAGTDIGIILGFFKGGIAKDTKKAKELFADSLTKISQYAYAKKVNILLEATNSKETSIANTLDEAFDFIAPLKNPFLSILPDTYHINLAKKDICQALCTHQGHYSSLHISDDNRFFPGLGTLDFAKVFQLLKKINYQGTIAIEGNIKNSFAEDVETAIRYLRPMLEK